MPLGYTYAAWDGYIYFTLSENISFNEIFPDVTVKYTIDEKDSYYFKDRTDIVFVLKVGILVPLSIVGTLLNVVSFWVWQAEPQKSTTTLLFMYLAVTDTIQLVFKSLGLLGENSVITFTEIAYLIAELGIVISVHTTTLIAINRWYAIWKPLHVRNVMTRRRVIVMSVLTSLWCAVLVAIRAVLYFNRDYFIDTENGRNVGRALFISFLVVGRVIPILVLLVCSISIVWMMVRHRRKFKGSPTTAAQSKATSAQFNATAPESTKTCTQSTETALQSDKAPQSNAAGTQSTETAPQSNAAATQSEETSAQSKATATQSTEAASQSRAAEQQWTANDRQRRLTMTVLCIAGCTFIAFPLGTAVALSALYSHDAFCDLTCYLIVTEMINVLLAINCGINFVFYTAFCTKFRELLKQRVSSCLCCVKGRPPDTQLN